MVLMNADQCRGLELERRSDGQLWARLDDEERAVRVHRCFPWSEPGRFLSLRDTDDDEFVLVSSIDDLDGGTRRVLEGAVAEAGFVLEVTRIDEVEDPLRARVTQREHVSIAASAGELGRDHAPTRRA